MSKKGSKHVEARECQNHKKMQTVKFTPEEDAKLMEIMKRNTEKNIKMTWAEIAREIGTKQPARYVRNRWKNVLRPEISRDKWSESDDNTIMEWVEIHKETGWEELGKILHKTGTQVRCRWRTIKGIKGIWTSEDDETIMSMVAEIGNKWTTIAEKIGRSDTEVRNRWRVLTGYESKKQKKLEIEKSESEKPEREPFDDENFKANMDAVLQLLEDGPFGEGGLFRENEDFNSQS